MTLPEDHSNAEIIPIGVRIGIALSVFIAMAAVFLFLLVSVIFLPVILRWEAAYPSALLAMYLILFALTVLPFRVIKFFDQIIKGKRSQTDRPSAFFVFSAGLLIPAWILIAMGHDTSQIENSRAPLFTYGGVGVGCVVLSMILAHLGIQKLRDQK